MRVRAVRQAEDVARRQPLSEAEFRWQHNGALRPRGGGRGAHALCVLEDAMATEKLAEGIRLFGKGEHGAARRTSLPADTCGAAAVDLEKVLRERIRAKL